MWRTGQEALDGERAALNSPARSPDPPAILLVTWRSGGRPGQYGRFRPR